MTVTVENHNALVKTLTTNAYIVVCPTCGSVGTKQDLKIDAEAIAERHREVGGFG